MPDLGVDGINLLGISSHVTRIEPDPNAARLDTILGKIGIGDELLYEFESLHALRMNLDAAPLTERQRAKLRAVFDLNYESYDDRGVVKSPADAYNHVRYLEKEPQEVLVVLVLNTRNRIVHTETVYRGNVNTSVIRAGELLRPAVVHRGAGIIMIHNHPSGDPGPSPEDVAVTRAVHEAAKLLDIEVLDHLVVGNRRFVSLKERGLA